MYAPFLQKKHIAVREFNGHLLQLVLLLLSTVEILEMTAPPGSEVKCISL